MVVVSGICVTGCVENNLLVKRRVKAGQLRQFWMTFAERLYQPQFPGAGQLKTKGLLPLATEQQQGQPA